MALSDLLGEAKRRRGLRALLQQARSSRGRSQGPPLEQAARLIGVPGAVWQSMPDGTFETPYLGQYVDPTWGRSSWRYRAILRRAADGNWILMTHAGQRLVGER